MQDRFFATERRRPVPDRAPRFSRSMLAKASLLLASSAFLAFAGINSDQLVDRRSAGSGLPAAADTVSRLLGEPVHRPQQQEALSMRPADIAYRSLAQSVVLKSDPESVRYAFEAYFNYRERHPDQVRKPYLYFVDFGLDARTPRGYVFDMDRLLVVEGPFHVAHGRGSVQPGDLIPTRFSNRRGSNATSLGLYLAQETYGFSGRSGGRAYRSVGLRLRGLSGPFNSAARERGIVVHGAPYVTDQVAGRSEGCPAMREELARELLPRIANGGMVFHFSPLDPNWLKEEPWVRGTGLRLASAGDR
jgi:hypothetical protein